MRRFIGIPWYLISIHQVFFLFFLGGGYFCFCLCFCFVSFSFLFVCLLGCLFVCLFFQVHMGLHKPNWLDMLQKSAWLDEGEVTFFLYLFQARGGEQKMVNYNKACLSLCVCPVMNFVMLWHIKLIFDINQFAQKCPIFVGIELFTVAKCGQKSLTQ